ncbi:hypothetical protein G7054_g7203 [Neopestalotiopsis clavispora]|nr:hypothetical protein G7054_g7203 [Neopestalotiopsis clavispora]
MAHNHEGRSSALICLKCTGRSDLGPLLATSLISAEPDGILLSKRREDGYVPNNIDWVILPEWPVLEEAAEYGQLCSSAAKGDQTAVSTILSTKPSAIRERNIFGQSPLHLAVHHPSCLRLLIKAIGADRSLLNILDADSESPLDYVMKRWGTESLESVKILLESDCAIWRGHVRYFKTTGDRWKPIIEAMKNRRERLKYLAIKELNDDEIEAFGLRRKTVLDGNAAVVWKLLLDKGITVPQALRPSHPMLDRYNCSMYHQVYRVEELADLWTLDFREINMLDKDGMPPLMDWRLDVYNRGYELKCEWLLNHGANLEEPLRRKGRLDVETQPITVCHNLFRLLGVKFLRHKSSEAHYRAQHGAPSPLIGNVGTDSTSRQAVIEKLLSSTVDDACGCKCSRKGCTPFLWFLKYLPIYGDGQQGPSWTHAEWPNDNRPCYLGNSIEVFTESFASSMSQDHLSEAIRCLTHAALGVKHTCCEAAIMRSWSISSALDPANRQHMSAEEQDEFESEQASLIDLLDSLVAEFEEQSLEDRDGEPLWRADPVEFWIRIWVARMNGVIEDLDGADLTSEEIRAAEDIGVEWKSPKPERPPSTKRHLGRLTFEEFKDEVDRIMSEEK